MKHLTLLISLATTLIIASCSCSGPKELATERTEQTEQTDLPERSFVLGSGGGFTGAYETYKIYSSGKVEQQNKDFVSYSFLKTIPVDSAKACFAALDELDLGAYNFSHPGNMTYLIELESRGELHTIKWGDSKHTIRTDVNAFFKRIRKMIRVDYE